MKTLRKIKKDVQEANQDDVLGQGIPNDHLPDADNILVLAHH